MKRKSRREFLKALAAMGVAIPAGLNLHTHKAWATTAGVTDPPYNCVGDGSDETAKVQLCIDQNEVVLFPPPPAGVGYGINADTGLIYPSNRSFVGMGGKIIRVGPFRDTMTMFVNRNRRCGNDDITFKGLVVEGRKQAVSFGERENCVLFKLVSVKGYGTCSNARVENCVVTDWPGTFVRMHNARRFWWINNVCLGAHRGGLIGGATCWDGTVRDNVILRGGDDAVAFNANVAPDPSGYGPAQRVSIGYNRLGVLKGQNGGCPIAIRGGLDITASHNETHGGVNAGILAGSRVGELCKRVDITYNRIYSPDGYAIHVLKGTEGDRVAYNHCTSPGKTPAYRIRGTGISTADNTVV